MSLLLAIDTSSDVVGVALYDGEAIHDATWSARLAQTATLLPGVDNLLTQACRSIADVEAVAVAIGPGSFSGLRVGLSVAKGLVLARDVALIGVSTLAIVAPPSVPDGVLAISVVAAGRGRLIWALVESTQGAPSVGPMTSGTAEELRHHVGSRREEVVLCGDVPEILTSDPPAAVQVRRVEGRAARLAEIGWGRWRRGEVDNPVALEPLYVHPTSRT